MACQQSDSERGGDATVVESPAQHPSGKPDSAVQTDRPWVSVFVAPMMLFTSSMIMALAWLGHLRVKHWPFWLALLCSWLLVLPEYLLNISAIRIGYRSYTGAQMASFNLCSGVVCVAIVSKFFLGEVLTQRDALGFTLMLIAMALIAVKPPGPSTRVISGSR